ncbi:hypothetical protein ILYODFUR_036916 [Ilyodon furcidens]|uniref:BED-type domain-containing protein n=1 Tax=Ilyodon furcidens TaxID=33524 RepID=A0ABV0T392_9TELE
MGTEFGTFIGTDLIPSVLPRTDSRKTEGVKRVDMNTALHTQKRNGFRSCWYRKQSMADTWKAYKSMALLLKCGADYGRCNICDAKFKASNGNTSNLRKHLVKVLPLRAHIFSKAEECTIFVSLRSIGTTPGFSTFSTPASVSTSLSAARNMAGY